MPTDQEFSALTSRVDSLDSRLKVVEADDAKVHGAIAIAYTYITDTLKKYPWASTLLPIIATAAGMYFAGPVAPPVKVEVPGPEKTIIREAPAKVDTLPHPKEIK